jgi:leader peptidase (prepilin peptidase)/N-methyltransferase
MTLIEQLAESQALLLSAAALLGLIIGSFLNVVILRLPRMMEAEWRRECAELNGDDDTTDPMREQGSTVDPDTLTLNHPPSHCPSCGYAIRPWENIPILSFLMLKGRCSNCGVRISPRYPVIEALTAVLSIIVVWKFGATAQAAFGLLLTWGLIALAAIDMDTQLLPDSITQPLLWLGLLLSLGPVFVDSSTAILGAAAGFSVLWVVFQLYRLLTGKEGMGHGDFKLLAVFGAWMGWQMLPQVVLLSALPGALFGVVLIATGRSGRDTPMPFGPFLAISGWISFIWGAEIAEAYLRFSGLA